MKILSVVGTRPNFIKIAPFIRAIKNRNLFNLENSIEHILVHTGQHYNDRMSSRFFEELDIPEPDINLCIGSGTHAEQLGKTMIAFEKVLEMEKPDWVVVFGDVNAVLSCSIIARKMNCKICHIEAGLRSGDRTMPEEINRIIADHVADLLLVPDTFALDNLMKEGISVNKIRHVGNIMIDTLEAHRNNEIHPDLFDIITRNTFQTANFSVSVQFEINSGKYMLMTLHRPSNVDDMDLLKSTVELIVKEICPEMVVIWIMHPRTEKILHHSGLWDQLQKTMNLILVKPLRYSDMLILNKSARIMLTDSGGLQEECTVLGTPCVVLRNNTERPVTLVENGGTCLLVSNKIGCIRKSINQLLLFNRTPFYPELWDGHTAERCLDTIIDYQITI